VIETTLRLATGVGGNINRRRLVADLLSERPKDLLVVSGLGSPCWDLAAAGDDPRNFYVWGAMGGASMVAMGLALARQQERVLAIVGDGEMLMGLGSLATIATRGVSNLAILVLDNERYCETGNQPTHTAAGVALDAVAKACGFSVAQTIRDDDEVAAARAALISTRGPVLVVAKITTDPVPLVLPPRDGAYLKNRFRSAVLGGEG
jgi:thiamine pyrophosphate-dependent acetolactate synthase large subunit-like protein